MDLVCFLIDFPSILEFLKKNKNFNENWTENKQKVYLGRGQVHEFSSNKFPNFKKSALIVEKSQAPSKHLLET